MEKEEFVKLMRIYEKFCGVKVLSFCVMSNHFHILLKVPPRPEQGSCGFVEGVINELNEQRYWSKPRKTGGSRLRISRGVDVRGRKVGCKKDELNTNTIKPSQGGESLWSLRHMQKE